MKLSIKVIINRLSFIACGVIAGYLFEKQLDKIDSDKNFSLSSSDNKHSRKFHFGDFRIQEVNGKSIKAIDLTSRKIVELSSNYQLGNEFDVNIGDRIQCLYCDAEHGKIPDVIDEVNFLLRFEGNDDPRKWSYIPPKKNSIKYIILMRKFKLIIPEIQDIID